MSRPNHRASAYASSADILADAHISEKPERLQIDRLSPEIQAHIVAAIMHGLRPVCIDWPDGKHALTLLESGATMPRPEKIIAAYRQCEKTAQIFPEGSQSWLR